MAADDWTRGRPALLTDEGLAAQLAQILALDAQPPVRPCALPPILGTGQRQGDVFVQPDRLTICRERRTGVWLADGQEVVIVPEGNRHMLRAVLNGSGRVRCWRQHGAGNCVLTAEILAPAYCLLVQPAGPNPHPPLGIGPGQYAICRQAEPVVLAPAPLAPADSRADWRARHSQTFVVD